MNTNDTNGGTEMELNTGIGGNVPPSHEQFLATVEALGEASGTGMQSMPNLAHEIARAVRDGIFDASGEKGVTDPHVIEAWDTYTAGERRVAAVDRSDNAVRSAKSKLQQVASAAKRTEDFANDVLVRVKDIRAELRASKVNVYPLLDCFVKAARDQLKQKPQNANDPEHSMLVPLNDRQIAEACKKGAPKSRTVHDKLESLRKSVAKWSDAENPDALEDPDDLAELAIIDEAFSRLLRPKTVEVSRDDAAELAAFRAQKAEAEAAAAAATEKAEAERAINASKTETENKPAGNGKRNRKVA